MAEWRLVSCAPNAKCAVAVYQHTAWDPMGPDPYQTSTIFTHDLNKWDSRFQAYITNDNTSNGLPNYDQVYEGRSGSYTYTNSWKITSVQSGYDFLGWYTLPNDVDMYNGWTDGASLPDMATVLVESGVEVTSDQVFARCKAWTFLTADRHFLLVPKFAPQQGVLAFDANGGNVTPAYKTVAVGSAYGTLPTPTRPGYTFAGWFTAVSGGSSVSASTTMGTSATAVIHAHWSATGQTRTIYFDATGGSCSTASKSATVGSAVGTLPTATRTGYTFVGWFRSTVGTDQVTSSTVAADENLTVYAHWAATTVTITFNANGGTVDEPSRTVPYGRQIQRLPLPVRPGQAFDGWFTAATGGTEVTKTTIATVSIEVFARWRTNSASLWSVTTF